MPHRRHGRAAPRAGERRETNGQRLARTARQSDPRRVQNDGAPVAPPRRKTTPRVVTSKVMAFSKHEGTERDLLKADLEATQAELKRRQVELRKETEEKLRLQAQYIERLLESRVAVRVASTHISYEVVSWDGDLNVRRVYEGLRTGEGLQLSFFEHRAKTSTPGAEFGKAQLIH